MLAPSLVGQTLDGVYLVERVLGRGSMGAVYAARDLRSGVLYAIKVLYRDAANDAEIYGRFLNEARVTSALRHPGIVQVFHLAELPDGSPYMVMEHLVGEDLHKRLRRVKRLPPDQALRICREVASALYEAHKLGIVHRDLKPGNIILCEQGPGPGPGIEQAKIIDFGVSQIRGVLAGEERTQDSQILGTPQFMSPEAALGLNSQLDGRSDQFGLAVILYRMLTGRLPFDADNQVVVLHLIAYEEPQRIDELCPGLPPAFVEALHRALRKRKEERFDTVIDFVLALEGHMPQRATQVMIAPGRTGQQRPTQLTPVTPHLLLPAAEMTAVPPSTLAPGRRKFLLGTVATGLLLGSAISVVTLREIGAPPGKLPVEQANQPVPPPQKDAAPPVDAAPRAELPAEEPARKDVATPRRPRGLGHSTWDSAHPDGSPVLDVQPPRKGPRTPRQIPWNGGGEPEKVPSEGSPAGSKIRLRNPFHGK